jgi:LPPG:FO 2-phospho-L-lactate transferase
VREKLRRPGRPIVAVSPIVGGHAVKGPLAKMLRELGCEPSALHVVQHYGSLIDGWIVDNADIGLVPSIERLGHQVRVCNTMMHTLDDKRRLAQDALELVLELSAVQVC